MKKILIVGNSELTIYKFRKELVKELVSKGYEVYVSFPKGAFGDGEENSKKMGCTFIETPINRRGVNPFQDIRLFLRYVSILRAVKPNIVLTYTVKPNIYCGLACRILKIHCIANITGLGSGLVKEGIIQKIMIQLYKSALKNVECVFFQNISDKEFFEKRNIAINKGKLIPGSGVNINEYTLLEYPSDKEIHFSYISRVMKAKGIDEYLCAAKYIRKKYSNTVFDVCGFCEEDYKDVLKEAEEDGVIVYYGLVNNILGFYKNSHCTVLPSYHPEGISNVLLESAACGRPLITTNRIGCKETVDDGVTGFLIKEKDTNDLIEKLEKFLLKSNEERREMGLLGRKKIEEKFNRSIVVSIYLNTIKKILT